MEGDRLNDIYQKTKKIKSVCLNSIVFCSDIDWKDPNVSTSMRNNFWTCGWEQTWTLLLFKKCIFIYLAAPGLSCGM